MASLDEDEKEDSVKSSVIYYEDVKNSRDIQIAYILQHIQRIPAHLSFATANSNGIKTSLVDLVKIAFSERYDSRYDEVMLYAPGRYIPYNFELMDLLCEVRTFNSAGLKDKMKSRECKNDEYDFKEIADYKIGDLSTDPKFAGSYAILRLIKRSFSYMSIINLKWNHLKIVMDYSTVENREGIVMWFSTLLNKTTNLHRKILVIDLYSDTRKPKELNNFIILCKGEYECTDETNYLRSISTAGLTRNAKLMVLCNGYLHGMKSGVKRSICNMLNISDKFEIKEHICKFQSSCILSDLEVKSIFLFLKFITPQGFTFTRTGGTWQAI